MQSVLSLVIKPLDDEDREVRTVVPVIDGAPLTELVERFEREHGFEPAGGYAGLVPDWFRYGPLDRYFLGHSTCDYFVDRDCYLLSCQCGEVGCWPLSARISTSESEIVWDHFSQEHRPARDYSGFGPFVFDLKQYRKTVDEIALQFRA